QPEAQIPVEERFDDRLESRFLLRRQLDESEPDHVVDQSVNITLDDVKEGIDELRLKLHREPADHAEIKERQPAVRHNSQVARVWICVIEAVLEKLLEVGPRKQFHNLMRILPGRP